MSIRALIHVNVRTRNLAAMIAWYERVLGFRQGTRPPFPFNGAWMYCGEHPFVHLVEVAHELARPKHLHVEHFAFDGDDSAAFIAHLDKVGVEYWITTLPEWGHLQVNVRDHDGNRIHVDFPPQD